MAALRPSWASEITSLTPRRPRRAFEKRRPEGLGLAGPDVQADDLALALGVGGHSDYRRDGDDASALALFEVGCIEPQIGPLAGERALEKGADAVIDVLAQLADGAFAVARQPHGLDQVVDAPGRDAADPGLLDHGHQDLLGRLARLEERRKIAALAELRDPELQSAEPGVERAIAVAVAVCRALAGSLVAPGADDALDVGFHQQLHDGLGDAAQEIAITGFGQQFGQR